MTIVFFSVLRNLIYKFPIFFSSNSSLFFTNSQLMAFFNDDKEIKRRRTQEPATTTSEEEEEEEEKQQQQTSGLMESLPGDIILDILTRLPASSLMQFKRVCQSWLTLTQDQRLPNIHLARATENNPCLLLHCDYPIRNQLYFVDSDSNGDYTQVIRKIDTPFNSVMPEFNVVGSCNGFLCLSDTLYCDPVFVYNPFTRDFTELPKTTQFVNQEVLFGFGFNPKTNEYKVLRIVYCSPNRGTQQSEAQIFTLGADSWRSKGRVPYKLEKRSSVALVNGVLHWLTPRKRLQARLFPRIISFDLTDEEFREVKGPDCGRLKTRNFCHLGVLRECLSAIIFFNGGRIEIWMMKEYNVEESWSKEFVIKPYVPFRLNQDVNRRAFRNGEGGLNEGLVRPLCLLKNGDILLEYKCKALVSYDPDREEFKDLMIPGLPDWFHTVIHVGSLISFADAVRMQKLSKRSKD